MKCYSCGIILFCLGVNHLFYLNLTFNYLYLCCYAVYSTQVKFSDTTPRLSFSFLITTIPLIRQNHLHCLNVTKPIIGKMGLKKVGKNLTKNSVYERFGSGSISVGSAIFRLPESESAKSMEENYKELRQP